MSLDNMGASELELQRLRSDDIYGETAAAPPPQRARLRLRLCSLRSGLTLVATAILTMLATRFVSRWTAPPLRPLLVVQYADVLPLPRKCAPWLAAPPVIAIAGFASWEEYNSGRSGMNLGGENYWAASLHFALRLLNVTVEFVDWDAFLATRADELRSGAVHRLIGGASGDAIEEVLKPGRRSAALDDPRVLCRVRWLAFWGNYVPSAGSPALSLKHLDLRNLFTPFNDRLSTPLPFFVHSLVTLPRSVASARVRPRSGLVLGKRATAWRPSSSSIVTSLLARGFTIYATCSGAGCAALPNGVVGVGKLSPRDYALLLRNVSFLLGLGAPLISPSPYEAIAAGAAYLNPVWEVHSIASPPSFARAASSSSPPPQQQAALAGLTAISFLTMHAPLASLGQPYVYDYDPDDVKTVLAAAERAVRVRFASFVPATHRVGAVAATVCANLIESSSLCDCAKAKTGGSGSGSGSDPTLDCRGSAYEYTSSYNDGSSFREERANAWSPLP